MNTKLTNFTEKPKTRDREIEDQEEERLLHERIEDIEEDDDFFGMNDYEPYAGYEGGEY